MTNKFIAPSYDVVFKAIFGKIENKPLLTSLLSSILNLPIDELKDLEIINSELGVSQIDEKNSILDLRIRLSLGVEIDVEIQVIEHKAYIERILSYWAKMYQGNLKVGNNYEALRKCIIVNIIGFNLFDAHNMHSKFQIRSESDGRLLTEHLEIHFIELSKLDQYNKDIENPLLCEWVAFLDLKNEVDMENLKNRKDLPEQIRRAIDELEELKKDPNMQIEATRKDMFIRDYFQGISDALREGEIKGKAIGLTEGELITKINIAKNLIADGYTIDQIVKITELSVEEINKLKDLS